MPMLTKQEIITYIAKAEKMKRDDVRKVIDAYTQLMIDEINKGEGFRIADIGTFHVAEKKESIKRNPHTGEPVTVPAGRKVSFKPAVGMKAMMKGENE